MAKSILTAQQSKFLSFVNTTPSLAKSFYLTGGTCLSEYYLQHRFSEDLDFFSEQEFDPTSITILLKQNIKKLGYATMEFQQSFNRNLYFFTFSDAYILKVEFTFYPFLRIESIERKNNLQIDSLKDMCVNKIFTIYQQPRGRDFYDVFVILKKTDWQLH